MSRSLKAKPGAEPLPLYVKPDKKVSLRDTMWLMRDHYEGTPLDRVLAKIRG